VSPTAADRTSGPTLPGSFIVRRARLRSTPTSDPRNNGGVRIGGCSTANPPSDNVVDAVTAHGLSARVHTAAGVDVTLDWDGPDCVARPTGHGPLITCERETAGVRRRARLRPLSTPNLFDVSLHAKGLTFQPPLSNDPVTVIVSIGGFARPDEIGDCAVGGGQQQVEKCKEVGVQPTPTRTVSGTPTVTATSTHTATQTRTRTATRTPPHPPTPLPDDALGERVFVVEPGILLPIQRAPEPACSPGCQAPTPPPISAPVPWSSSPACPTATASRTQPGGDATLDIIVDGSRGVKLLAASSGGSIDCDSGALRRRGHRRRRRRPTGDAQHRPGHQPDRGIDPCGVAAAATATVQRHHELR
jgi:hypothetical protein